MKSFHFNITFRILLIIANIFLIFFIHYEYDLPATSLLILIILYFQIYNLVQFVNTANKEVTRFLQSVKYSDFSQNFSFPKKGKSFAELGKAMNEVIREFQETRSEKEENFKYLETVLHHIDVGLISYSQDGKISFINNAAKKLLNVQHLVNINNLESFENNQLKKLIDISPGEKDVLKLSINNELIQIIVAATKFKQKNKTFTLISLQNIQNELEEQELIAWNKLIRVLTHEIMNSITPISSLAGTVNSLLHSESTDLSKPGETFEDISDAITAIEKRSVGLINFVNSYRSLTRIPQPNFKIARISEIFNSIENLFQIQLKESGINFSIIILPKTLDITTDPALLEQVLINILKNAIEAIQSQPEKNIELKAYLNLMGKPVIEINDNGPGIKENVLEKLFIPFFTTKQNGSGIGLSLSKQIIRMLGGNIKVNSGQKTGTTFTINFYR
ncbi:MAG: PAS domain-containing sensor histidine kinase [Rhodothermaceae bacterium]